ncbi:4Fe-4S dicluster domain-containing protein [Enterocloster aldenensis]|uniref:4Fe-4S dicluster domain-containing protein n=1 Tax=Enterocloster aldenensis TaxID=358742 RepID=UPI004029CBEF
MGKVIDLDFHKCSACGACAVACMDQNDLDVTGGVSPFRVVCDLEDGDGEYEYYSIACFHCDDAPCITACPCNCLSKDGETGFTVYDNTNCIGCHSCAMACPFGAPCYGPDGKMIKCDGCAERVKRGLEPACVRNCPTGALTLMEEQELKEVKINCSLKKLMARADEA